MFIIGVFAIYFWSHNKEAFNSPSGKTLVEATKSSGSVNSSTIRLTGSAGVYHVPIRINDVITLDFVLDSGAAEVTIPADVVRTLIRAHTIRREDFLPGQLYSMADGSTVYSERFIINKMQVGDLEAFNVTAAVGELNGPLLLGQSFLSQFPEWHVSNSKKELVISNSHKGGTDREMSPAKITAENLAVCIFTAAEKYSVPPTVILGLLHVQGGRIGEVVKNSDGTTTIGPMRVGKLWIPQLSKNWNVTEEKAMSMVRDDACTNVGVGAWIARGAMNQTGSLAKGIGYFGLKSRNPDAKVQSSKKYREQVLNAMRKYRLVKTPSDLLTIASNQ